MVRRSQHREQYDMGQVSSQPAALQANEQSPPMAQPLHDEAKKKRKKRKSKAADIEDNIDQREQSASMALVHMAQGGLIQITSPQTDDHDSLFRGHTRSTSARKYGSEMTPQDHNEQGLSNDGRQESVEHGSQALNDDSISGLIEHGSHMLRNNGQQQIIVQRSQKLRHTGEFEAVKKTRSSKRLSKALNELEAEATQLTGGRRPSTPSAQRERTPLEEEKIPQQKSSHPLDDISTDDEVDEIANGTQALGGRQPSQDELSVHSQNSETKAQSLLDSAALPMYSASQRQKAIELATQHGPTKPRKRKRNGLLSTDAINSDRSQQKPVVDLEPFHAADTDVRDANQIRGKENSVRSQEDSDENMPIDPNILHSLDTATLRRELTRRDSMEHQTSARPNGIARNRKRRRVDELRGDVDDPHSQGDEGNTDMYESPYGTNHNAASDEDIKVNEPAWNGRRRASSQQIRPPKKKSAKNDNLFGPDEISQIEAFRDVWCLQNNRTVHQFNGLIQANLRGNHEASELFKEIEDMFPDARPSYVQRFCRRKFHNFSARGQWHRDDDDQLRRAVAIHGQSWKKIGEMIERFPEDCRDRWRNYLDKADNRNSEQWTEAETLNLAGAILDCLEMVNAEKSIRENQNRGYHRQFPNLETGLSPEDMKLVNWQSVSDRMGNGGGSRSRLQCSMKWNRLKEPQRIEKLQEAQAVKDSGQVFQLLNHPSRKRTKTSAWRTKQALDKIEHWYPRDKVDLLEAILASNAPSEGNIPWQSIGPEWWRRRWSTQEMKAAWNQMKEQLLARKGHEDMEYEEVAQRLLSPLLNEATRERWDPTTYDQQKKEKKRKPPIQTKRKPRKAAKARSQERVPAEDEEILRPPENYGPESRGNPNMLPDFEREPNPYLSRNHEYGSKGDVDLPQNYEDDFGSNAREQPSDDNHDSENDHRGGSLFSEAESEGQHERMPSSSPETQRRRLYAAKKIADAQALNSEEQNPLFFGDDDNMANELRAYNQS